MDRMRVAVLASCLAIVLVGHTAEGAWSDAGNGDVVTLSDAEVGASTDDITTALQSLGKLVRATPTPQVHAVLEQGFTPALWKSWHREAANQNLDAEASVAVLNSYLCASVDNGNKVMHVMSWIKKALRDSRGQVDPKHEALKRAVKALKQRVQDTQVLSAQTHSPVASELARKTETELGEAQHRLRLYESKDGKLDDLKKVAADKKAKAESMQKELDDKQAAEDAEAEKEEATAAGSAAGATAAGSAAGASTEVKQEKAESKAEAEAKEENKAVESEDDAQAKLLKAKEKDAAAEGKHKAKIISLNEKAKAMHQKGANLSVKAQTAAADATEAMTALKAGDISPAELASMRRHADAQKRLATKLQKKADAATLEAENADQQADPRINKFKGNLRTMAQEARIENEGLLRQEKEVFDEEKATQAKLVEQKVEGEEKIRMAQSTLSHAEETEDTELVKKAHELVLAAGDQAQKVDKEVVASTLKLSKSAKTLQKLAHKAAENVADDYKVRIHDVITKGRAMRKTVNTMMRAQNVKKNLAKRQAKEAGVKASAAYGAVLKAKKRKAYRAARAEKLEKEADTKDKIMEPLEAQLHVARRKMATAKVDLNLAQQSESKQAMFIAGNKYKATVAKMHAIKKKLRDLGRTPEQLRALSDHLHDRAVDENDVIHKANQAVDLYKKSQKESLESADDALQQVHKIKEQFLPKLLRHIHRKVAYIEHELAKQVSALNKMGQIKPTKTAAAADSAKEENLEAQLDAQKQAAKLKIVHLKKLRTQVNGMRKQAEVALQKAKEVEDDTEAANSKIKQLKAEACTKADQLEKQLADAESSNQNSDSLKSEVTKAKEACSKAGEDLTAARNELKKKSAEVAELASKAGKLDAKYSSDDENIEAKEVDENTEEAVEDKAAAQQATDKLNAVVAMQKQAIGKEAEAKLMLSKAQKKGDKEELNIATAALAAAKAHVAKLKDEKTRIVNSITYATQELGELHSSIRDHVVEIKDDEIDGHHEQKRLGEEQRTAMAEAATTQMQQRVDSLQAEVSSERRSRELEESALQTQGVNIKVEMEKMKAKLDSIDTAAAAIIDDLELAIAKGKGASTKKAKETADETATNQDLEIADDQLGKLQGLKTTAADQVKKAEAAVKANATDPDAAAKLAQAKKDLSQVEEATTKISARKEGDVEKLANETSQAKAITASDKTTGAFAEKIKAKFQKLKNLAETAGKKDVEIEKAALTKKVARGNTNTKALEERINALEAAVAASGGNVQQIEAGANATAGANPEAEQKINDEKLKLKDVRSKILDLDEKMSKATSTNDTKAQIEYGTEQKDLEVEEKNVKDSLDTLYKELEASSPVLLPFDKMAVGNQTAEGVVAKGLAAASNITAAAKPAVHDLNEDQKKLTAAMAEAEKATAKRAELMKKEETAQKELKDAVKSEQAKIDTANKEKEGLANKMHELTEEGEREKAAVEDAKHKLSQQEESLKTQEAAANQNMKKVNSKLESASQTLKQLNAKAPSPGATMSAAGPGATMSAAGAPVAATKEESTDASTDASADDVSSSDASQGGYGGGKGRRAGRR